MKELTIHLAAPRGFCAGVRRAVGMVEQILEEYGAPIYVRHEIVHNRHVIEDLCQKGVVFIENWNEITDKSRPVIFSAHGVSVQVKEEAAALNLKVFDATCPLVERVHQQMHCFEKEDKEIIIIGKPEHVEIIGTVGQVKDKSKIHIIKNIEEAEQVEISGKKVGFVTQTTLSKTETREITACLHRRFPELEGMKKDDICYATTNRQLAVAKAAESCQMMLIIGSQNSSNTQSLKKVAEGKGCKAFLIDDAADISYEDLEHVSNLGISAGASAPDYLLEEVLEDIAQHYDKINIIHDKVAEEHLSFKNRRK